ncbi:hypothetical protein ACRCJU_09975, partial [Aerococcus urinaeequi]|uniref:hypothetical protein n=1 Tax=Aerococcus urinaeequi TaxID=51665 RepID=UPI003D6A1490
RCTPLTKNGTFSIENFCLFFKLLWENPNPFEQNENSFRKRAHLYTTFQVVLFSSKIVRKKPPSSVSDRGLFDVKISIEI